MEMYIFWVKKSIFYSCPIHFSLFVSGHKGSENIGPQAHFLLKTLSKLPNLHASFWLQ